MSRRAPLSPDARAELLGMLGTVAELRQTFAGPVQVAVPVIDPKLADKRPRGRSIEEVAAIVGDVEALGAKEAARRHRMSASGVRSMAEKWRTHPVVAAALEARRPAIEARVRGVVAKQLGDLDAKVRRMLGG